MGRKLNALLTSTTGCVPTRVVLAGLCLLGFVNLYMVRLNLSVSLVAMVHRNASLNNYSAPCVDTHTKAPPSVLMDNSDEEMMGTSDATEDQGEMKWSETVQGFVLGSFFYGYATTQVVGGRAAEVYGTRWVFGGCILAGGVASMLTPVAARTHYGLLIALRVLQGVCQGVSWPCMHPLVTRWIPPLERPRFIGIVYFAATMSASITVALCGIVIATWGWPAAFYVTGTLSLLWCVLWFTLMYDHPAEHPRISKTELEYIEMAIQASGTSLGSGSRGAKGDRNGQRQPAPWRHIFTSLPVWAILVSGIGNSWGSGIFFTQLPTYMKNILGFSIKASGLMSALPFLSRYMGTIIWGSLADALTSRGRMSVLTSRRIASMIAMWGPAVMLVCLATTECNWRSIVAFMCVALFCNGAVSASSVVNHTDLAPNYAGTLLGIDNTLGSITAFVAPVVVGIMTDGQQTQAQWRKVFWICVPIYGLTEVFYLVFASATVQRWNFWRSIRSSEEDVTNKEEEDGDIEEREENEDWSDHDSS